MSKVFAILLVLLIVLIFAQSLVSYVERLLPTNGYELPYSPLKWNLPPMVLGHNCYDYAFNNYDLTQKNTSQPGELPNAIKDNLGSNYSCPLTNSRLISDHNGPKTGTDIIPTTRDTVCPANTYKIALVMDPNDDYHFLRQNSDGTWSHKPGKGFVTNKDFSGNIITDPETADMKSDSYNYDHFCSYFCISTDAYDNFD
jgi:hypothetical protein